MPLNWNEIKTSATVLNLL